MENLAIIKQRIIYFVEHQGIKKEDFYKKISSNGGNFRGKSLFSELSGDKIAKILATYPQINPDWLLLGNEPMLRSDIKVVKVEENHTPYSNNINFQEKYYQCIEEKTDLYDKNQQLYEDVIKLQKEIIQIQRESMPLKKTPATTTDNVCQV